MGGNKREGNKRERAKNRQIIVVIKLKCIELKTESNLPRDLPSLMCFLSSLTSRVVKAFVERGDDSDAWLYWRYDGLAGGCT